MDNSVRGKQPRAEKEAAVSSPETALSTRLLPPPRLLQALELLAQSMARRRLQAVLVGTAAAVVHGAEVTTGDVDFLWVDSAVQRRRLSAVAKDLGATLTRPFFHRSLRWHLESLEHCLVADFVGALDGVPDVAALVGRVQEHAVGAQRVRVAALEDVVRSKQASGRPRDLEVLPVLEAVLRRRAQPVAR